MNLILNEPCGVDAFFEGGGKGSAQVVADRISEQLRNPSQLKRPDGSNGGYPVSIIGLNGCWGCGKSNVIELVRQNFSGSKDQANFVFFEYDLWGHRLDLTRKMFLEELIDFLCDEKNDIDAEFKEDVKRLTGKTVERESVDALSIPAIICALGFLSLPFLQLAADLFKEGVAEVFHWGALIVSFAFWGCLVLDLSRRRTLKVAFSRVMGVARGVSPARIDFEHEIEPSIGRFTNFLREVVGKLGQKKKTLVVILDNMDRLLPEEVVKCLAAIHILFAEKRQRRPHNFKVIVPYDAVKVGSVFAKIMNTDINDAHDYFQRTFDVTYGVSQQFGSRWEAFFDRCYEIVSMGDVLAESQRDIVRQTIDSLVPVEKRSPRKLIAILNEISEVWNTMSKISEGIGLRDVALFVCAWPKFDSDIPYKDMKPCIWKEEDTKVSVIVPMADRMSIDDLIVSGAFIPNSSYVENNYARNNNAKIAIASLVYQVEDSNELMLPFFVLKAMEEGTSCDLQKHLRKQGFDYAYRYALGKVNILHLDKVPMALRDCPANSMCWDEFYELRGVDLVKMHRKEATMLEESERITLTHISDWAGYAQELRNHAEDIPKRLSIAISIESALQEKKQTQVNSVPAKLVSPEEFRGILLVCERQYNLLNVTCDWAAFDRYCAELVGREGFWAHFYPLRFLEHTIAVQLEKTRQSIERCDIPLELPTLDYYLGVLENISEGIVWREFDRNVCDAYTTWMADPKNLIQYNLSTDNMECRVVALALRYGGFPWNVKEIDELINKKNGWESVCVEDELLEMSDHYLSRAQLFKRVQELNRPEPLFQNVLNRLKRDVD